MANTTIETTVFVLQPNDTLPTTGGTYNLAPKQFGVFKGDLTAALVGTVANEPYIILGQGRNVAIPGQGAKRSDKIYKSNVIEWYKATPHATALNQITDITAFTPRCGESVTISLRIMSNDILTAYHNGLLISYTEETTCCDCGTDPCETLSSSEVEDLVDKFVTRINTDPNFHGNRRYVIAERLGSGSTSVLRLHGTTLPVPKSTDDPTTYPHQYDRLYFWAYAYKGPEVSIDYLVEDRCNPFAEVEVLQESTYPRGNYKEVKQLEKNYFANNKMPGFRRIYSNDNFNDSYESEVIANTYYEFYFLKFVDPDRLENRNSEPYAEGVIIANPVGENSTTITMLTTFLGTPADKTGLQLTSTTTTVALTTTTTT